jgi:recombinational DNA repair ATPase RecF
LSFATFKALRHVKLDLECFTVLVGPNPSGKTCILEGLYYLTRPIGENGQSTQSVLENPFAVWTRGTQQPMEMTLEAERSSIAFWSCCTAFAPR